MYHEDFLRCVFVEVSYRCTMETFCDALFAAVLHRCIIKKNPSCGRPFAEVSDRGTTRTFCSVSFQRSAMKTFYHKDILLGTLCRDLR